MEKIRHPSLVEYINRAREWYDLWVKLNGPTVMPWAEVEQELRAEHKLVSSWDPEKRDRYWYTKAHRNKAALLHVQKGIGHIQTVAEKKEEGLDSLREIGDIVERKNRRKKK